MSEAEKRVHRSKALEDIDLPRDNQRVIKEITTLAPSHVFASPEEKKAMLANVMDNLLEEYKDRIEIPATILYDILGVLKRLEIIADALGDQVYERYKLLNKPAPENPYTLKRLAMEMDEIGSHYFIARQYVPEEFSDEAEKRISEYIERTDGFMADHEQRSILSALNLGEHAAKLEEMVEFANAHFLMPKASDEQNKTSETGS